MVTESWKEREGGSQGSLEECKVIAHQMSFWRWGSVGDLQEKSPLARADVGFGGFAFTWPIQCRSNAVFSDY